jgi:hypothetical protein
MPGYRASGRLLSVPGVSSRGFREVRCRCFIYNQPHFVKAGAVLRLCYEKRKFDVDSGYEAYPVLIVLFAGARGTLRDSKKTSGTHEITRAYDMS